MKKILLINPKGPYTTHKLLSNYWKKTIIEKNFRYSVSGFGLSLLIVAALTPKEYEIEIIDENIENINFNSNPYLVCLTANTQQALRAYKIASVFRDKDIKTVIGGIHATVLPEEASLHCDHVIVGEGEPLWRQFLIDFENMRAKKIYQTNDLFDLKDSPIPRYDLLKKDKYKVIWVESSRGCPHDCNFCVSTKIYGKKYRVKPIDNVVEEIKVIKGIWKSPQLSFCDDNIFVNKDRALHLIEELEKLNIRYLAQTDITVAEDEKFIRKLRDSGCAILFIGFESLKEGRIGKSFKNDYVKRYSSYIQRIQKYGIGVFGAFILGYDQDSVNDVRNLVKFVSSNNLYATQVTILTPYPGSYIREKLLQEKRISKKSWEHYNCTELVFNPKSVKSNFLENAVYNVYKEVYSEKQLESNRKYFENVYKNIYLSDKFNGQ